ncbi:hypothetical protein D3C71_1480420 [compost metagenome]
MVQADILLDPACRQRPGHVGGDHRAVLAGHAGGGHHAVGRARAGAEELGQDRAQAGVVGIAELAVLQQLYWMLRVGAGLHPGHADMRAAHIGGQERRHRGGQGMGRYRVGGCGHTGSWMYAAGPTRRLSGVCNRSDNDVNDNLRLSMLRRNGQ